MKQSRRAYVSVGIAALCLVDNISVWRLKLHLIHFVNIQPNYVIT